uniref:Thymus-specific serine protease n=1 Tax=Sphaeramia orbicularis TaxID=375764 RepID=A0A673AZP9_9TELE
AGQKYYQQIKDPCLDVSHKKTVKHLMNTSISSGRMSERQWIYQTCTEFGFYQTCEDAACPFSGMLTLQADTELCPVLFGISQHSLPRRIAFTNSYYGEDNPHTHRVLYVNGGVDPWKALSVMEDRTECGDESQLIFIKDTAHCADMMHKRNTDRSSLRNARKVCQTSQTRYLSICLCISRTSGIQSSTLLTIFKVTHQTASILTHQCYISLFLAR